MAQPLQLHRVSRTATPSARVPDSRCAARVGRTCGCFVLSLAILPVRSAPGAWLHMADWFRAPASQPSANNAFRAHNRAAYNSSAAVVDYGKLLVEHLDLVDRVVRYIARRHHLTSADVEEFASVVRVRLIDHDYAILRKFQGRSNLGTYLTTVIERLYLDFCVSRWGRWRPSATAKRLGPEAVMLEQLLGRDGFSFDEAVACLHTNHQVSATRDELHAMSVQLPARIVRRTADQRDLPTSLIQVALNDRSLEYEEDQQIVARVEAALAAEIAALPPRNQLILKLRFQDGMTVADIARLLQVPPKGLYRELDGIVEALEQKLRSRGIDQTDIGRIVGHPALALGRLFENLGEADDESV
jgi:RNA polymerase sigma factor (sigma-70 family)